MTPRLLEMQCHDDQHEAELARLVASESPASLDEVAQRRVHINIFAQHDPSRRWIPALVLVTALLLSTTLLGAPRIRHWVAGMVYGSPPSSAVAPRMVDRGFVRQQEKPRPETATAHPVPPNGTGQESAAAMLAARVDVHHDRPLRSLTVKRRLAGAGGPRAAAEASHPDSEVGRNPPPEEAALVMTAVGTLRREHNPARAGVLLDAYLGRFPKGVLIEEALALGIEAAVARQDTVTAKALAHRYLGCYPNGWFIGLADKALRVDRH